MKEYNVAIYLRLSKEDKESNNSIDMQREITTKYATKHNYNIVEEYVDNGYSGILSSRPALNKLMIDIIRNKINMVIVKDMSRLTRDKNLTAYYTDIFFPDNDVRLISVTEYIDTGERYEIDDVVALRGIVNQSYLEDISKKIKAVKRNFKEQGKFIEGSVAYGYKKDKNDKHKIVVDKNVSNVVKRIFEMYVNGVRPLDIANKLNSENIATPSQYLKLKRQGKYWTESIVDRILNSPIYCGRLVLNKSQSNLRLKKVVVTKKKDYEYIDNTHEPIISPEVFDKVQEMKKSLTKENPKEYIFLLRDLVYCENCGRRMVYKNSNPVRVDNNGKVTGKLNDKGYFICTEHYRHKDICNEPNKIMENDLNEIVLKKLSDRLKYLQIIKYTKDVKEYKEGQNADENSYKKIKNDITKKESNFKILYSKKVEGIITEEEFLEQYNEYKKESEELRAKLDRLEKIKGKTDTRNYLEKLIIEFESCKNFDNNILKKMIEKIEIGKEQKVKITLKV